MQPAIARPKLTRGRGSEADMDAARAPRRALALAAIALTLSACRSPATPPRADASDATSGAATASASDAVAEAAAEPDAATEAAADTAVAAAPRDPGPYELPWPGAAADAGPLARTVFYVAPTSRATPQRLLVNLHGICNPPGYACGYWVPAAAASGFLICPTGNARCGKAQYDAPTWTLDADGMDRDLETAIGVVEAQHPGEIGRDGAILTGFSKGAYAAVTIAARHPGRWPYLILNEADVSLSAKTLKAAQVRAVALIAGELSGQAPGERRTAAALEKEGFPVKLWLMPKAGHWYSENIDTIMREAIAFVVAH
jgi:predicted esterase